jgi:hypothetical protein
MVRSGDRVANRNRDFVATKIDSPLDIAITRVEPCVFEEGEKSAVPLGRFGASEGLGEDVLFIYGYPGTSPDGTPLAQSLGILGLRNRGLVMLARLVEVAGFPTRFDACVFSAVGNQETVNMGDPGGMSGSFVWRTNFTRDGQWSPACATVCGLVQRWDPDRRTFICTKVEEVRQFIDDFVRGET